MVRNDDFFLRKWVEYYGRELGKENLYIYYDGEDQAVADICQGTNVSLHPKIGNHVIAAEKGRLRFLSERAAELFARGYEVVIGVDADEYIVVDPKLGIGLREYLSRHKIDVCLSPLGLDFGQKLGEEDDLSFGQTFLSQRHYAQIGTRYTKASIIAKPCQWGSGFHRVKGKNYYIASDLYLMHFGYADSKTGTHKVNKAIAKKRANTVKEALVAKGINVKRISTRLRPLDTPCPHLPDVVPTALRTQQARHVRAENCCKDTRKVQRCVLTSHPPRPY